jgi:2-polyprenyl-3-methyl-5-hydroxy-6-metoxy-1,4-benzoquinol methylase
LAGYQYVLDNKWEAARDRLTQLEQVWDTWTIRNLQKIGVGTDWRCLEVAGGGGSIAAWLGSQVGLRGYVVATDLEPGPLDVGKTANVVVANGDPLDMKTDVKQVFIEGTEIPMKDRQTELRDRYWNQ